MGIWALANRPLDNKHLREWTFGQMDTWVLSKFQLMVELLQIHHDIVFKLFMNASGLNELDNYRSLTLYL